MKRLEKIASVACFVVGIGLIGVGLYRDNKFPEEYWRNTLTKGVGLILALGCSPGIALKSRVQKYIKLWV